jgi:hypothetical protein
MVIEMLLNNDIQLFFFVQMIFKFQKEINVIMYIIEFKKKYTRIISFEQHFNKYMNFQNLCFCNVYNEVFDKWNVM